jgi:hypothetical protein
MTPQRLRLMSEMRQWVKTMNKNPFEVRLDVMKMAQEMLETEHRTKMTKVQQKIDAMKAEKAPADQISKFIDDHTPQPYTPDEVVARSSALYNFVSTSTKNHT